MFIILQPIIRQTNIMKFYGLKTRVYVLMDLDVGMLALGKEQGRYGLLRNGRKVVSEN
jgi:hypothetical protein